MNSATTWTTDVGHNTELTSYGTRRGGLRCVECHARRDLSWLVAPRRISPSDVDGLFLVANGQRILFVEFKAQTDHFDKGQKWALEALSRKPGQDVLLVTGTPPRPTGIQWCKNGAWGDYTPSTDGRATLQDAIDDWFAGLT